MKFFLLLLLSFLLQSCFSKKTPAKPQDPTRPKNFLEFYYPKATYTPGVYDGNPEPPYPDLDEDVKTLEGIDADKDGLRDDLEIWINRISKDENERNLWRQTVKIETSIIISDESDFEKGLKYLRSDSINVACGTLIFAERFKDMFEKSSLLSRFIVNTKKRKKFYTLKANAASPYNGGFATREEILLMNKCFCDFQIKNKQDVVEGFRAFKKLDIELTKRKISSFIKDFEVRNERGVYENFFGIKDYKACLELN